MQLPVAHAHAITSDEAPSTYHLRGIDEGIVTGYDVIGSDRVRMRDRKLHHRL
jgi:hypothetical protein